MLPRQADDMFYGATMARRRVIPATADAASYAKIELVITRRGDEDTVADVVGGELFAALRRENFATVIVASMIAVVAVYAMPVVGEDKMSQKVVESREK